VHEGVPGGKKLEEDKAEMKEGFLEGGKKG
jgi:hypothetical protein